MGLRRGDFLPNQLAELYGGLQRDPTSFPVQYLGALLSATKFYASEHGEDMPEVADWHWSVWQAYETADRNFQTTLHRSDFASIPSCSSHLSPSNGNKTTLRKS
jgi:hypothetical protein